MSDPTAAIRYEEGDAELLDLVGPLWDELIRHHEALSRHFADAFVGRSFAARKAELVEKSSGGRLRVDLAKTAAGDCVGYCVATIDARRAGEIDSLFVRSSFRGQGIGAALMKRALAWMDDVGTQSRIVEVAWDNEKAWSFYRRFAFLPRSVRFMQKAAAEEP